MSVTIEIRLYPVIDRDIQKKDKLLEKFPRHKVIVLDYYGRSPNIAIFQYIPHHGEQSIKASSNNVPIFYNIKNRKKVSFYISKKSLA